jgi:hypothetical protein
MLMQSFAALLKIGTAGLLDVLLRAELEYT